MMTIIYFGLGAVILIIGVLAYAKLRTPRPPADTSEVYTTALNYLITGEKSKALEKLREAVRADTNNVDAYLKIGDILRDQGSVDRATKIHRGLILRPNLTKGQKITVLESLIKDYQANKNYQRAIQVCQKLLEMTNNEIWAQELLLKLYEESADWENACDTLKKIQKARGKKDNQILALYKVEAGLKLIQEGKERDGRIKFREAIKLDKKCPPAYLYLSDSYIRENRPEDALAELEKFSTTAPQLSYLGFSRIKEILFREGMFSEAENIFESLLHNNPNIEPIRFALADIYERKGEIDKALNLCYEASDRNPASRQAKRYLARLLAKIGRRQEALQYAFELIDEMISEKEQQFTCKNCGFISTEPKWHCPSCHHWNTFIE